MANFDGYFFNYLELLGKFEQFINTTNSNLINIFPLPIEGALFEFNQPYNPLDFYIFIEDKNKGTFNNFFEEVTFIEVEKMLRRIGATKNDKL